MTESKSLRASLRRRFVRWYMGRIAGRYCPCEWPIKSKRLMHLCGRIDDVAERESFRDSFWLNNALFTATTSTASNVNVTWTYTQPPRKRHGDKP